MEVKTSSIMGFLGPFLLLVLAFYFVPVILTVILSFTSMDYKLSWDFVGFSNFEHFLTQSLTYKILLTTLIYVALTLIFNVGIAFLLALMT
ncbi:MAG: sugar ABC transporter permease, partial [Thermotogae bacterium]|nr:sugar ABC transporter permease [Thermotogota bacterium]